MTKRILTLFFATSLSLCAAAQIQQVNLQLHRGWEDPTETGNPPRKAPMRRPVINQEDHTLQLQRCAGYVLQLIQNDVVVYQYPVFVDGEIQLPIELTGEFELQLHTESSYYVGYIIL